MTIAIIGNGISGITAARTIRKKDPDVSIVVISSETKYFFSRTALMYVYMGHMKFEHTKPYEDFFWAKNRIDLILDRVEKVDFSKKSLMLSQNGELSYDKLLLATGSKSNMFNWPGQDYQGVQGLYSYQDLELLESNTHAWNASENQRKVKNAVIIGGGLIGVELAEMLMTRKIQVTFIIREDRFWGNVLPEKDSNLIQRHLKSHGIKMEFNTELKEIKSEDGKRVSSIITSNGDEIKCQLVGLTVGVSPNVDFLKNSDLKINRGILVNKNLETNVEDVFAAGDCVEFVEPPEGRRSIEQVWYTGRMMGEIAGQNILGKKSEYKPGPWFNSAKFFDVEYQNYGLVGNSLKEDEADFYWENKEKNIALKLVFNSNDRTLIGLNVYGMRLRHAYLDEILRKNKSADFLLENWKSALFDPEFYHNYGPEIIESYNSKFSTNIKIPKRTWLEKVFS